MRIRCKTISAAFKLLLCLAATAGIVIQSGILWGSFNPAIFNYYTLISNMLCAIYFGAAFAAQLCGNDKLWPEAKGALVMGITVTGLVYHFMLSGGFSMQGTMALSNFLLHYAVPVMAVLDWLLFDPKPVYRAVSPLLWVILPNAYFVYSLIFVALGGSMGYGGSRYPYPFVDIDALGLGRVLVTVVILNVAFLALGYIYLLIDRLLGKQKKSA